MPAEWGDDTKALYEVIQEEGDALHVYAFCLLALCVRAPVNASREIRHGNSGTIN